MEQRCEGEVRVARRVGTADLGPRRLLGSGLVERDPDQRGAIALRPRDVDRRFIPWDEPLVRVHPLREDGADLARVAQLTGDERLPGVREMPLVVTVEE